MKLLGILATGAMAQMNSDGLFGKKLKLEQWGAELEYVEKLRPTFPSTQNLATECNDVTGQVIVQDTAFDCKNIDFVSYVNLDDMKINQYTNAGSDIWGWEDGNGREVVLMCVNNGVWFIDTTVPEVPKVIGSLPSLSERGSTWCDVKVYKDVAYIVKDAASPDNGIQVFDLKRLNSLPGVTPGNTAQYVTFQADFVYTDHGDSHNILIDNDSGYLYSVGANNGVNGGTGCRGGLHMVNLEPNPLEPKFAGCVDDDGYTHDAQCVVYDGPDDRYTGKQICFAFNEDTLTIWDVTFKRFPRMLSRQKYDGYAYCHQGWITADMNYLLLDDELDETYSRDKRTKTYLVNIQDLRNPIFEKRIIHELNSIDHNLYFWGAIHAKGWGGGSNGNSQAILPQYAYLSNYASGIRVVELKSGLYIPKLAGYFDVSPEYDVAQFYGTWSNYMFTSGMLAVSSIERGLFVLKPRMAFEEVDNAVEMESEPALNIFDSNVETEENDSDAAVIALSVLFVLALIGIPMAYFVAAKRTEKKLTVQFQENEKLISNGKRGALPESSKGLAHFELS